MPAFYPEGDEPKLADPSGRSLHKINNLLKSIDAKTGSTTITGPVTVSNEVEVTNSTGNPIPVSGTVGLDSTSLAALENISVTFPATQNVNVTNAGLSVSVSNLPATQPVSGSVSVSNLPTTQPVSGSVSVSNFPATQPVSLATAPTTPVTGTFWQATQPTRETQPTGDYVINTSAFANFAPIGSVLTSSAFDAGANADYVVITLEGGGSSGAFSFDLSILNTGLWDPGTGGFFNVYYDIPATSSTDTYSYRNVNSPTLFGSTRTAFNGRFIIPLTQNTPYAGTSTTYRYIRLNCPASYGGWRYRFTSYKSVNSLLSASVPGNPSTTRVAGRVDVGYISNLPALPTGTNTIGSVNVLGGNATAVKVDGSAVTQPVSIASAPVTPVTDNGGSLTVDGTVTVNDMTSGNAKTKIVDSTGADVSYIPAGTAGTPSSSVLSVQGISGGVSLPISGTVTASVSNFASIATDIGGNAPPIGIQLGFSAGEEDFRHVTSTSPLPISGTVSITDTSSTGATPTNFSSLTYATISASNASRKGLTIFNEGPGLLYVTLGTSTTTSSSFTVRMSAGDYYEVPFGYIGLVGGIFGTAGNARVTEIT
jgi:hypothetical protein